MPNSATNAIPDSVLPEADARPDACLGGEPLSAGTSELFHWGLFPLPELSLFNLPVYERMRRCSYHKAVLEGPFDLQRLVRDYRNQLYRSSVGHQRNAPAQVDNLLFEMGEGRFVVYEDQRLIVLASTPQAAHELASALKKYEKPVVGNTAGFYLVSLAPDGIPYTQDVPVQSTATTNAEDLQLHYGDDFIGWENDWLAQLERRRSGVTLLFGPPGCGKTSYLRAMMARFISRFVFYYVPVSSFDILSSPHFVGFWLKENRQAKDRIKLVIVEDAEEMLLPRDEHSRAKVSNLLNIGDGFMGEHLKLHVIATTNTPMQRLDPALLRPGRLMGTREFRRLSRDAALRLAQAKGLTMPDQADASLAELYNRAPDLGALMASPKVGFAAG